jgi:hypothetical protein
MFPRIRKSCRGFRPPVALLLGLAAVGVLGGCNTFQSRAREKAAVYQSLPPDTQERLHRGHVSIGDSQDMVYIALGYPDEVRDITTAQGVQSVWIYRTYWQQYEGSAWVGWHRRIIPMSNGRGYYIVHEPVRTDVYRTRVDEVIRVTFHNGTVSAVEQRNR